MHNDFPLAPEKSTITEYMLSSYSHTLYKDMQQGENGKAPVYKPVTKLLAMLYDKKNMLYTITIFSCT